MNELQTISPACQGVTDDEARLRYQLRRGNLPLWGVAVGYAITSRVRLVTGLPRRSFSNRSRFEKRRLVEAAGIEPASESIPLKHLRA